MGIMTKSTDELRSEIESIAQENGREFGDAARRAVATLLRNAMAQHWMYVYELIQNAIDAGAKRVRWEIRNGSLVFQHNGSKPLDSDDVRGIASVGRSTKGHSAIGFMGVGFKSVFSRFSVARVCGFRWRFRFELKEESGEYGATKKDWFGALSPVWDESAPQPDQGFTTLIALERPAGGIEAVKSDLRRLDGSSEGTTSLAVLALRGLEQVDVLGSTWRLEISADNVIAVRSLNRTEQWKAFRAQYRPDDSAIRRFLEVRQELRENRGTNGERALREVVALLPLDSNLIPRNLDHGKIFSTLPTEVQIPFGFHLQGDWFVNVDRQSLRDVQGDAWQQSILNQVPVIIGQMLEWIARQPESARQTGYSLLRNPDKDDSQFKNEFGRLHGQIKYHLDGLSVVPICGTQKPLFRTPATVARLPASFLDTFGAKPNWHPEILFGMDLLDQNLLGRRGTEFADWMGWGKEAKFGDLPWPQTLGRWWESMQESDRFDALQALWKCVEEQGWKEAPVVPTQAGTWVHARNTRWLGEPPPNEQEPGGGDVKRALRELLPSDAEKISQGIREKLKNAVPEFLKNKHANVKLADLIRLRFNLNNETSGELLVSLAEWAISRSENRHDLVPLVFTEQGPREIPKALLADPFADDGMVRRAVFPQFPALASVYNRIKDVSKLKKLLETAGVLGPVKVIPKEKWHSQKDKLQVAKQYGVAELASLDANKDGYVGFDYEFPFDISKVRLDGVQNWLTGDFSDLRNKGVCLVQFKFFNTQEVKGKPSKWIMDLQSEPWVLCKDGHRRRPGDIVLRVDPMLQDAPLADINELLAKRLEEEGLAFGANVPRAPVLRTLIALGQSSLSQTQLASLLAEAQGEVANGNAKQDELDRVLAQLLVRGTHPLERIVEKTGSLEGGRDSLSDWVLPLTALDTGLQVVLRSIYKVPETTTGLQTLSFLRKIWTEQPKRSDERIKSLAVAYQYLVHEATKDPEIRLRIQEARDDGKIHLYAANRQWHPASDSRIINDIEATVKLPISRTDQQMLLNGKDLGKTPQEIRAVAKLLNLKSLSEEINTTFGKPLPSQRIMVGLDQLLGLLNQLHKRDSVQPLTKIKIYESIQTRFRNSVTSSYAHISLNTLYIAPVAADPSDNRLLPEELAVTLSEHFHLPNNTAIKIACLRSPHHNTTFEEDLIHLASLLEVEYPSDHGSRDASEPDKASEFGDTSGESQQSDATSTAKEDQTAHDAPDSELAKSDADADADDDDDDDEYDDDDDDDDDDDENAKSKDSSRTQNKRNKAVRRTPDEGSSERVATKRSKRKRRQQPRQAADHARIMTVSREDKHESGERHPRPHPARDDKKARSAVMEFESRHGRLPKPGASNQPGFDIVSYDPVKCERRYIEVKGVAGTFVADASVVLTGRQVSDALQPPDENGEYWLYIVELTDTRNPRVLPIRWTGHIERLRFAFYAKEWLDCVDKEGVGAR
jgi:hypothetical protein